MREASSHIELSASDLSNYAACHHLTYLDLRAAIGALKAPGFRDPLLEILQERGAAFEKKYLSFLADEGFKVEHALANGDNDASARTIALMKSGAEYIYQATLKSGIWNGRADFLKRVEKPSLLGPWSYEVIDTKLSKETKVGTLLQIAFYSDMISQVQGVMPENMYVMTPEDGFLNQTFRVNDFIAYYRFLKKKLEIEVASTTDDTNTYPNPVSHCEICRWWQFCYQRRKGDDHLSLVAGLANSHVTALKQQKIETLEAFAKINLPLPFKPSRGAKETFERLREQARVQLEARVTLQPVYELLPIEEGSGFYTLPAPSTGDIFFDLESDPFAGTNGIEYLFGWLFAGESSDQYHRQWAFDAKEEKEAFENFVDMVMLRWLDHPDMHIYHYTPYEPGALKRLMGKYASKEIEIDKMLRAGLFVDLYRVTKQTLLAGVEKYSLKDLEIFHAFERKLALREASLHLRGLERLLERNNLKNIPAETISAIELYNKEDCLSTKNLRDWLEEMRNKLVKEGNEIPRPVTQQGEASEPLIERQLEILRLYQRLAGNVSLNRIERNNEEQARWLLANMLDWYRREKKSVWWEYFRLIDLQADELIEEKSGIARLHFTGHRQKVKRSVIDRYDFPEQDIDIREGDSLYTSDGKEWGEVIAIDTLNSSIEVKKGPSKADFHPAAAFKHTDVRDKVKEDSIMRIGTWVAYNGIDSDEGTYRAGRDLLLKHIPRTKGLFNIDLDSQQTALDWAKVLSDGVLPIQGPPGAGKSHTAARMIIDLVRAGKKVGITALSHKVIRGLLDKVVSASAEQDYPLTCVQRVKSISETLNPAIIETEDNKDVLDALQNGKVQLGAGTTWLWAAEEFFESVDYLFVDEAGQLSLIDTIAVSQATKNIILLGDPQQLKQPQKGSHPEGTEVSALEHILEDAKTILPEKGIFLDKTWRLHPNVCSFISELFYEGRLHSKENLINQLISGNTNYRGAGLWFEPVVHEGNRNSSSEEVERVVSIVRELTTQEVYSTDSKKLTRRLSLQDILIIAPYNAQVVALKLRLPERTHIGTVDKFQGQEAAIVIFSMTTSSPEDAPRGMEFLYSLNRLNVAVSRAKAVCILVASPKLFEPTCRNPNQMKMANAFCRYLEMSHVR